MAQRRTGQHHAARAQHRTALMTSQQNTPQRRPIPPHPIPPHLLPSRPIPVLLYTITLQPTATALTSIPSHRILKLNYNSAVYHVLTATNAVPQSPDGVHPMPCHAIPSHPDSSRLITPQPIPSRSIPSYSILSHTILSLPKYVVLTSINAGP